MAYVLRFDPSVPHRYQVLLVESIGFVVAGKVAIFAIFRLYHRLWRFVDQQDFESILKAVITASVVMVAISYAIPSKVALHLPRVLDGAEPDEVIIAIPSAPGVLRQKVVTACRERGIPVRTLPTVFELLSGTVDLMRQVREVQVEDVLGREPVRVEIDRVGAYLSGKVV